MRLWLLPALIVLLATPSYANTSECWGIADDPSHPELSCTPLTQDLLTGLEGASRAQVTQAMGAPGALDDAGALSFESNFAFRRHGYGGFVAFTFSPAGHVVVINAAVDAPHHRRGIRFVWNASVPGCSDFPGSIQRCENLEGAPRQLETDDPPPTQTRRPRWLPAWLWRSFFFP